MAFVLADRIKQLSTTSGTSNFTLGAAAGVLYQTFSAAGVTNGSTTHYIAVSGTQWETGQGTYTSAGPTLSRDTIFHGSSGVGVKVNFAANPTISVSFLAETFGYANGIMRQRLAAALTINVPSDFATLQLAWDHVCDNLDLNSSFVTIQLADGTYTAGLATCKSVVGGADSANPVIIKGNAGTPANVKITTTGTDCFSFGQGTWSGARVQIKDMELSTVTSGNCIQAYGGGNVVTWSNIRFASCAGAHISAGHNSFLISGNYAVTGNAVWHLLAQTNAVIAIHGQTLTFSNSPAFSQQFAAASSAQIYAANCTFTNGNTVTGQRYLVSNLGLISIDLGGALYLPGTIGGTSVTGGLYVVGDDLVYV